jgi:hypothetical protein
MRVRWQYLVYWAFGGLFMRVISFFTGSSSASAPAVDDVLAPAAGAAVRTKKKNSSASQPSLIPMFSTTQNHTRTHSGYASADTRNPLTLSFCSFLIFYFSVGASVRDWSGSASAAIGDDDEEEDIVARPETKHGRVSDAARASAAAAAAGAGSDAGDEEL